MVTTKRSTVNPILLPNKEHNWEAEAAFNGSVVKDEAGYSMVYRAISLDQLYLGIRMNQSTVGLAQSGDGIHFKLRKQLITPELDWEQFGCEDPRMTKIDNDYYICYTAISSWPPGASGIKCAVAKTHDFKTLEKHLVTFFNAKAMVLFPEKINGKYVAILTAHTDLPPSRICIAYFDTLEQMWDEKYWREWYKDLEKHELNILKSKDDQIEVGAVPVKTSAGWVLLIGFVQNYFSDHKVFRIDAVLLDPKDPQKVIGQTVDPLLLPEEEYEIYGSVPNVIFPSGALIEEDKFVIYYGATDTTVCRATIPVTDLIEELQSHPMFSTSGGKKPFMLERFAGNPIISPVANHPWETKYTFNPAAIYLDNKVHILYRAMGDDDTSVIGYASSPDGFHLEERLDEPVYVPREEFEKKRHPGFSGCEDPRLTLIDDTIYMCYTAYDGVNPPRIGLSTIQKEDFIAKRWAAWTKPILISAPGVDNKDSCIVAEKIGGRYAIFHRLPPCIWIDFVSDLKFGDNTWIGGHPIMGPRANAWDSLKIGLGDAPNKTEDGWLMIYHGVSKYDVKYRLGAALLDLENPNRVIARLNNPILEPEMDYENKGYREGTVFACGSVIIGDTLYIYYGGADKYVGVATCKLKDILDALKKGR